MAGNDSFANCTVRKVAGDLPRVRAGCRGAPYARLETSSVLPILDRPHRTAPRSDHARCILRRFSSAGTLSAQNAVSRVYGAGVHGLDTCSEAFMRPASCFRGCAGTRSATWRGANGRSSGHHVVATEGAQPRRFYSTPQRVYGGGDEIFEGRVDPLLLNGHGEPGTCG
jgi:hypothetical protein